ncbi:hypothetical protein KIPB_008227 [Kipferlia bialata]|uniref:NAD(P)-binding domain-containing protein n=1 Tax=Kipferlia bialata TaxID=797122 RepID=A0A9K3GL52_9EUKA|nr:hypothetical protein KIPB_008227 [Kipferlia bialata]|eukprot:g8227.t1
MRVCIVGISGKLGQYMVQHCLARGYEVVGVCREQSVDKLSAYEGQITLYPGPTNDRSVIERAVSECDAVLTVLAPWGVQQYSSGTARAVLDFSRPDTRLIFSCGWHISYDGQDVYSRTFKTIIACAGAMARCFRVVELKDQDVACNAVFESGRRWTVVRGSDLEEGESQGLPVWAKHVGVNPILKSNMTRRTDFALFMVASIEDETLVQQCPAICGCMSESALEYADQAGL